MLPEKNMMPRDVLRLAALGTLLQTGQQPYQEFVIALKKFTGTIVSPSLDMMGTSVELLRYEGLLAPVEDIADTDVPEPLKAETIVNITQAGKEAFIELMTRPVRTPGADDLSKLVLTLRIRFLHHLPVPQLQQEAAHLADMFAEERDRLASLRAEHQHEDGYFTAWLDQELSLVHQRLSWLQSMTKLKAVSDGNCETA